MCCKRAIYPTVHWSHQGVHGRGVVSASCDLREAPIPLEWKNTAGNELPCLQRVALELDFLNDGLTKVLAKERSPNAIWMPTLL